MKKKVVFFSPENITVKIKHILQTVGCLVKSSVKNNDITFKSILHLRIIKNCWFDFASATREIFLNLLFLVSRCNFYLTSFLRPIHWFDYWVHFRILVLPWKALHGQTQAYISELLHAYTPIRALRSCEQSLLIFHPPKLKIKGDRPFLLWLQDFGISVLCFWD